jgi:hypothetical protein
MEIWVPRLANIQRAQNRRTVDEPHPTEFLVNTIHGGRVSDVWLIRPIFSLADLLAGHTRLIGTRLQRAKEFQQGFFFGRFQLFKFLGDIVCFAAVAENRVGERERSAVMHEPRTESDAPEGSGTDFVRAVLEFGDGETLPGDGVHLLAVVLGHRLHNAVAGVDIVK